MDVFHSVGEYVPIYHYTCIHEHMHTTTSKFRGRGKNSQNNEKKRRGRIGKSGSLILRNKISGDDGAQGSG